MSDFKILDREYGKSGVKVLHITRNGSEHSIREFEVETKLVLATDNDYKEVSYEIDPLGRPSYNHGR